MRVRQSQPDLSQKVSQQFLRFRLGVNFALETAIEIDRVTELITIPLDRVVPMPHLPPAVMGVYNWRGEILWIVDFSKLLGLKTEQSLQYNRSLKPTIVLSNLVAGGEVISLGLVVDKIEEIEWCNTELVQPKNLTEMSNLTIEPSLIKGYWQSTTGEKLLILDRQAVFNCTQLQSHI